MSRCEERRWLFVEERIVLGPLLKSFAEVRYVFGHSYRFGN